MKNKTIEGGTNNYTDKLVLRYALSVGLTEEQISVFNIACFDYEQKRCIIQGFMLGLSMGKVKRYAKPWFDYYEMTELLGCLMVHDIDANQVQFLEAEIFARQEQCQKKFTQGKSFNRAQIIQIKIGIAEGLDDNEIFLYARECFTADQMTPIRIGLKEGLSIEQVKTYARQDIEPYDMENMLEALLNDQ